MLAVLAVRVRAEIITAVRVVGPTAMERAAGAALVAPRVSAVLALPGLRGAALAALVVLVIPGLLHRSVALAVAALLIQEQAQTAALEHLYLLGLALAAEAAVGVIREAVGAQAAITAAGAA